MKGLKHTEITKQKIRLSNLGKNKGNIPFNKGKKMSVEQVKKMSLALKGKKGKLARNWKGGITPIIQKIRNSDKYKYWRQQIFIRDNFTCKKCEDNKGGNLEAHHKKSFSKLIEEIKNYLPLMSLYEASMIYSPLWDLNNGITYCKKCHEEEARF